MDVRPELRKLFWNTEPKSKFMIPSSRNPLINASRAIAVSAYPSPKDHVRGGKAEKYSGALLAHIARTSKALGYSDSLPPWAKDMRAESMQPHLLTGYRNLLRALTIRSLIDSAVTMKNQHDQSRRGERVTFTLQYSPDLESLKINIPVEHTVSGYSLSGKIPDTNLASLRTAILYHQPALKKFQGPAIKADGRDTELDYQNALTRHVRPALFAQHIVQVVWEQINAGVEDAIERGILVDELLMRQPE